MDLNISVLESQNHGQDWPLIVSAVYCQTCGAQPGEVCRSTGSQSSADGVHRMLVTGQQRIDWHQQRKIDAATAWYARKEAVDVQEGMPVVQGEYTERASVTAPELQEEIIKAENARKEGDVGE